MARSGLGKSEIFVERRSRAPDAAASYSGLKNSIRPTPSREIGGRNTKFSGWIFGRASDAWVSQVDKDQRVFLTAENAEGRGRGREEPEG
jgi:hypothetical protein